MESTDKFKYNPKCKTLQLAALAYALFAMQSIRRHWGYPIGCGELTGEEGALRISSFLYMIIGDTIVI